MIWLWAGISVLAVLLVLLDRFVLHPRPEAITPATAVARSLFWFLLAMLFNAGVFFAYETGWLGAGVQRGVKGDEASLQFLTAFVMEFALDLDTVFVIAAVFSHFRTPEVYQHRVLFWGVLVSVLVRASMILTAGALLLEWPWFRFVLAGLLVLASLRMILIRQENTDPEKNLIIRALRRFVHVSERLDGANLVTRIDGRTVLTPLLVTLLLVETADAIFAFDSIPASYAVAREPFLIFAANLFAVLCLRALYPALRSLRGWLRYVKIGLAMILAYAAIAIALPHAHRVSTEGSLAAVLAAAGVGAFFAARWGWAGAESDLASPLGPDAERLARMTLKPARKLIVLVVGLTIVVIGILMMIGPGPGLLVVPIGLAVLASEFLWAKRLLRRYSEHAQRLSKRAEKMLLKRPRPWLIAPVLIVTLAVVIFLWKAQPLGLKRGWVISGSIPTFVGETVWAVLTVQRYRELKRAETKAPDNNESVKSE